MFTLSVRLFGRNVQCPSGHDGCKLTSGCTRTGTLESGSGFSIGMLTKIALMAVKVGAVALPSSPPDLRNDAYGFKLLTVISVITVSVM